jgi:hypothetical protein
LTGDFSANLVYHILLKMFDKNSTILSKKKRSTMLLARTLQNTSKNRRKDENVYRFDPDYFWEGAWVSEKVTEVESDFIKITRKEYLQVCTKVPKSGCVNVCPKCHETLYKLLLARAYLHFRVTGIKAVYLIKCIEGDYGKKYVKITSHEAVRKLIGGRADVSHASGKFWEACYERIKQEDVTNRPKPLEDFTEAEREIWRAFVRRASKSCNSKKLKKLKKI